MLAQFDEKDLELTDDGDLAVGSDGDFAVAIGAECLKDSIIARLRTQNPDWFAHPLIGADLDDAVGEPNLRSTSDKVVSRIISALTFDGLLPASAIKVVPLPISPVQVIYHIQVMIGSSESINLNIKLNLEHGIEEVL